MFTAITHGSSTIAALEAPVLGSGGHVWDGARFLCAFLESPPGRKLVRGSSVLELGAGTHGAPGLLAALLGARAVLLTDRATLVPHLRACVEANACNLAAVGGGGGALPAVAALEFGGSLRKALGRVAGSAGAYDLILLSECLSLSPTLFPLLWKTLRDAAPGLGVLVAYRPREGFEGAFFEGLAMEEGWRVKEVARGGGCSEPGLEMCDVVVVACVPPWAAAEAWEGLGVEGAAEKK